MTNLPADELNARYDPMNRDELIAECERLRELLSIAQDRNAEHCAEVQRLERLLNERAAGETSARPAFYDPKTTDIPAVYAWVNERFGGHFPSMDEIAVAFYRHALETPAPLAGLLSWGLRPILPQCELSLCFDSVDAAIEARERLRHYFAILSTPEKAGEKP